MKIDLDDYRIGGKRKIRLKDWATNIKPLYKSEEHYKELLAGDVQKLNALQRVLYASNSYAVLLIFQAMDAAGKDGAISHVLTGINPQGCEVYSFKAPSAEELEHDFLWRTTCRLPERGRIGVFNRSYYEEVLVVRVHPEYLRAEGLAEKADWKGRYHSIANFEKHIHRNGTRIIKFFLHLSKEEQRKRFLARIDEPDKNWKFGQSDLNERKFWSQYQEAFEGCLGATGSKDAPWWVVPADDKNNARLIISRIVVDTLKGLDLSYPKITTARQAELLEIRKQLEQE